VRKAGVSEHVSQATVDAYEELSHRLDQYTASVAVRSSATAEDAADTSFAGMNKTFTNVSGVEPVLEAVAPPFIPDHEGVDIVERVGAGVVRVSEGDRVAVPWLGWACGECEHCASGWETLCLRQSNTGYSVDGGYAEYVIGAGGFVGQVSAGMDPLDAAPLTCAG
jgi:D-arabinose 1-dehydrogenase-like Zn-dependent alcohol dehydrogenase